MLSMTKLGAVGLGMIAALATATVLAQQPGQGRPPARSAGQTLVVNGLIDWLDRSDVSALREGVLKHVEFQVGDHVKAGTEIARLHDESAILTVEKAKVSAEMTGAIKKAQASKELALVQLAMLNKLRAISDKNVSYEEYKKQVAEVEAASAAMLEAQEQQRLAQAELAITERFLAEHSVLAPFNGYVTEKMKNKGESVRANDAILRIVRTDVLRFHGYLPLEAAVRIKGHPVVEVRPVIDDADLPIEQMVFQGKISELNREVATIGRTEVQVFAEITNSSGDFVNIGSELLKGMKAEMTIFLDLQAEEPAKVGARTAVPAR